MRPVRLRSRNLRTYPELDLEFGDGLIGILGELRDAPEGSSSNGSGKSTILEAIDIALWGRRSLAGYLTRGGDVDDLMVELTFAHAGETYRIRRSYSAKGRGKTVVDFERFIDSDPENNWEPLTLASAKETDSLLVDIIGMSKETFRDSSYLRQGAGGFAASDRDPRERKQLLVEAVMGRDPVWPQLNETAKARRRATEAQIEQHRAVAAQLAETVATGVTFAGAWEAAAALIVTAQDAVSAAEQAHTDITERYQAAREQTAARATAEAEKREAVLALATLEQRHTSASDAIAGIAIAREEIAALTTPEQTTALEERERELTAQLATFTEAVRAHDAAKTTYDAAQRQRDELQARAGLMLAAADKRRERATEILAADEGAEHCEMCKQRLGVEAAAEAAQTLKTQAVELDEQAKALMRDHGAVDVPVVPEPPAVPMVGDVRALDALAVVGQQAFQARANQTRRAALTERVAQLQPVADPGVVSAEQLDAARSLVSAKKSILDELEPINTDLLLAEGRTAREALDAARARHTSAIAEKARADERLEQANAVKEKLAALDKQIDQLLHQVDRDLLLERATGPNGIPALIIENTAIPYIETEASRILRALGTSFDVQLRTQAENKTGGLRDTLDVVVIDQDGSEADFDEGYSGGEKTRIQLALQIALARVIRNRGGGADMLALDEPSYLDAAGMVALLDVLRGLEGEFSLILLVSHVAELRDALEETITVVKEAGVSSVVGSREPAEVVAS